MISSAKLNMFLFIHEEHKRIIQVDNTYPLLLPSISSGQLHKHRIITLSDLTINKDMHILGPLPTLERNFVGRTGSCLHENTFGMF